MKSLFNKAIFTLAFLIMGNSIFAQADSGSNTLLYALATIAIILFFFIVIKVADNLLSIEAKRTGANVDNNSMSIFPAISDLFAPKMPAYTEGQSVHILKKGHDILLEGEAEGAIHAATGVTRYAIQPGNFLGLQPIPKMMVEVGDSVKAGDQLFFDKKMPEVKFVAPVSGEVIEINRGAKRAIAEIVILADKEQTTKAQDAPNLAIAKRNDLRQFLLESGAWTLFTQRPFNVIPAPTDTPRDIFISTFDSAPLAPCNNKVVAGNEAAFQQGIDVLAAFTMGKVHLGLSARGDDAPATAFTDAANAEKHYFHGAHPAGNVGTQIHHIAPIGGEDKVWTLGVQEVITLGNLFLKGAFDASRVVAVTGNEVKEAKYVRTYAGANLGELLSRNTKEENIRIISGDVLSGEQKAANNYLNWTDDQVSVISEGDYYEMFGWLLPLSARPSISKTFPNFLFPEQKFAADTNTHGEKRAFVVTAQYEEVLPMDIYPQHLMKAIIVNDFERMEGLGLLELVEEDVALCEFVCTSKQPLQKILREGLETMREQG